MSLGLDLCFSFNVTEAGNRPSLSSSKRAGNSALLQGDTSLLHMCKATALYKGLRKQHPSTMIHHSSRVCALNAECIWMHLSYCVL